MLLTLAGGLYEEQLILIFLILSFLLKLHREFSFVVMTNVNNENFLFENIICYKKVNSQRYVKNWQSAFEDEIFAR